MKNHTLRHNFLDKQDANLVYLKSFAMRDHHLPIGVVMPTLNVRALLPAHLAQMRTWIDLVEEVIVVDSYSNDGTPEFIEAELHHPRLRILQHPRGLYQSWNYGIAQVGARFTYVSTAGEMISREGLQHLAATAQKLNADVVLSRPELLDLEGRPLTDKLWPIHRFLDRRRIDRPTVLRPWHAFMLAALYIPESILGSSASNLYLTDLLKRFPFPAEYGHTGDTAWGVRHTLDARLAVTPEVISRFVLDPATAALEPDDYEQLVIRLLELACQTACEFLDAAPFPPVGHPERLVCALAEETLRLRECQERYGCARHEFWPWFVNPGAWNARAQRNRQRERLYQAVRQIWKYLDSPSEPIRAFGRRTRLQPANLQPLKSTNAA